MFDQPKCLILLLLYLYVYECTYLARKILRAVVQLVSGLKSLNRNFLPVTGSALGSSAALHC